MPGAMNNEIEFLIYNLPDQEGNVFTEGELQKEVVVSKMEITTRCGAKIIPRDI